MRKHDAFMFAAYLVVIAVGVEMMSREPLLGFLQILVCAGLFGLRAYAVASRMKRIP